MKMKMKMKTDKFQRAKWALAAVLFSVLFLSFLVVLLPPLGAYASETTITEETITEDDMKKKWDEFAAGVAEKWGQWEGSEYLETATPEEIEQYGFMFNPADYKVTPGYYQISSGMDEYRTAITLDELSALDNLDKFLFQRYYEIAFYLLPNEGVPVHIPPGFASIYRKKTSYQEYNDLQTLLGLVEDYNEYAIAFWEQTGLVYSPYEDIFYVQAGVPYEEGQAAGTLAPTPPPNDGEGPAIDESVFEGMTAEERRELEQDIEDFWADDGGQNGRQGGGTNGLIIGGIALAAVAVVAVIAIILSRKKRKFMSDPK
jgi:hypothetical protein